MVQLYTGRPPFSSLPEPAALMRVLDGERPERQPGLPAMSDGLWQHIAEFWAQSPDTRPPTRSVVQKTVWPTPGPRTASPSSPGSSLLSDRSESSDSKMLRSYSLSQTHARQETLWPSSDDRISTLPGKNNKTALKPIRHRSQPIERQGKTLNAILNSPSPSSFRQYR
jgi:hypothetical protein